MIVEAAPKRRESAPGFERVLGVYLIGIVVLAPLPFGANRPWSEALVTVLIALGLLAWGLRHLATGVPLPVEPRFFRIPAVLMGLVVGWAWLQSAPLPAQFDWVHPIWSEAGRALGRDLPASISVDRDATRFDASALMALVGLAFLFMQLGRSGAFAARTLKALTLAGLIYATYGLVAYFAGNETILWFEKWAYFQSLTSTFVNRNSFATYAGMVLLCALALLVRSLHSTEAATARNWPSRVAAILDTLSPSAWLSLLTVPVTMVALLLTDSRGGSLGAVAGVVAFLAGLAVTGKIAMLRLAGAAGVAALLVMPSVFLSGDDVGARLAMSAVERDERPAIFRTTLDIVETSPLLGGGYGAYPGLFDLHRSEAATVHVTMAHNTYLEFAATLGVPATAALCFVLGWVAWRLGRGARNRRRDWIFPVLSLAVCTQVAAHAFVDFSLQIPANAAICAAILGIGIAQSERTGDRGRTDRRSSHAP